jgi:hydrogenase maturation protein HypF
MEGAKVRVSGIVQGVGFRPFVYRIAVSEGLKGYVKNISGSAVEIWVEGEGVERFLERLSKELPPVAKIEDMRVERVSPVGYKGFEILRSDRKAHEESIVPPDLSICDECLKEVLDPKDRRYRYAFNSCAYCGPRYSMMYFTPYDRGNTSMNDFPLCKACTSEYEDPYNVRRFHAQGISCPECGPILWLTDAEGKRVEVEDPIAEAAKLINDGKIVAIKGLGGFHIAASAFDDHVVEELRKRKRRPEKPFAVMVLNMEVARGLAEVRDEEAFILLSRERPILLLEDRHRLSPLIAPGLRHVGIFLPYTALHHLLLMEVEGGAAIMTSGNPPGKPMVTSNEEALGELKGIVEYFLLHNRNIVNRVDDSVVRPSEIGPIFLRRGRGYTPLWIKLRFKLKRPIIAFGAEIQNAGAIGLNDKVVLTQYIGDVDDASNLEELDRYLEFLIRNYRLKVKEARLAIDLHPGYASGRLAELWAEERGLELVRVQHHWAHLLAGLAETGEEEGVGVAIDGVGYGPDGKIWGGEVLEFNRFDFKRLGGLEPQMMPGGDRDALYPLRMAISIAYKGLGEDVLRVLKGLGIRAESLPYGKDEVEVLMNELSKGGGVITTSTGRVLDAASSILGICSYRSYDGEPAIKLEARSKDDGTRFRPKISEGNIISTTDLFLQLLEGMKRGGRREGLAYAYQYALGEGFAMILENLGLRGKRVFLSGGAAVNEIIRRGLMDRLSKYGCEVYVPKLSPPGDGGIAVGQVIAASP